MSQLSLFVVVGSCLQLQFMEQISISYSRAPLKSGQPTICSPFHTIEPFNFLSRLCFSQGAHLGL